MKKEKKAKSLSGKEAKAQKLLAVASRVEELEEELSAAKQEETALKTGLIDDLAKEQVKAFTHAGYDFFVVTTDMVVVKNATAVLDYCRKKFKQGLRESVDKETLNYHIKQEKAKVPGTAIERRTYLRFKEEK